MEGDPTATPIERDVVIVTGADAASYLQTQLTQDVEALDDGASAWSFLLDPKSRIVALVRVTHNGDRYLLDVEPGYGDRVRERIDGFLFRTDVSFDVERWSGVAWRGAGSVRPDVDAPIIAETPWRDVAGYDVIGPGVQVPDGVESLSADVFETLRVCSGWPSMGAEIDGVATPAETGLVDATVSFTKGCYTGQEFVARVHYRNAEPPRHLVRIRFHPSALVEAENPITIDDGDVGTITSVAPARPAAIGYVKRGVEIPCSASSAGASIEISGQ